MQQSSKSKNKNKFLDLKNNFKEYSNFINSIFKDVNYSSKKEILADLCTYIHDSPLLNIPISQSRKTQSHEKDDSLKVLKQSTKFKKSEHVVALKENSNDKKKESKHTTKSLNEILKNKLHEQNKKIRSEVELKIKHYQDLRKYSSEQKTKATKQKLIQQEKLFQKHLELLKKDNILAEKKINELKTELQHLNKKEKQAPQKHNQLSEEKKKSYTTKNK